MAGGGVVAHCCRNEAKPAAVRAQIAILGGYSFLLQALFHMGKDVIIALSR
jgi:hypothetical protein